MLYRIELNKLNWKEVQYCAEGFQRLENVAKKLKELYPTGQFMIEGKLDENGNTSLGGWAYTLIFENTADISLIDEFLEEHDVWEEYESPHPVSPNRYYRELLGS